MDAQGFSMFRYFVSFAIVITLLYVAVKMLKNKKYVFLKNLKNNLSIEERLFLGRDKEIVVLKYESKKYILGITGNNIEKIDSLDLKDGLHEEK